MGLFDASILQSPFFEGLTHQQISRLEECALISKVKSGALIFERGREAQKFFLIRSGQAAVELYTPESGPKPIQPLGPGDFFGTSWLLPPHTWKADARAQTDCEIISFNGPKVLELCNQDHDLGYALMMRFFVSVSKRLESMQKQTLTLLSARRQG